jgi:cytosine/adenosine deaminase-related metal-dependent hydrolase
MTEPPPRQAADTLISGALIVTMDAERRVIGDGAVAILGDRIVAIGKRETIASQVDAHQTVDGRRFVVTPGLINTHVHVTGDPLIRGFIPEDLDFMEVVFGWATRLHQAQTPDDQRLAAQLAAVEMLQSGTTCFLEAGTILALDEVADSLRQTGIRGLISEWVMDRAFDPADDQTALTDRALRTLEDEIVRHPLRDDTLIAAWPSLVGHQTNTNTTWRFAKQLADQHGLGVSAHMSPSALDAEWYLANTGRRPVEHLAKLGVLGSNVSLTHAAHLDAHEVALLAASGASVAHCPMAALKGGYGVTAVGLFPEMAASGVNLTLGTDAGVSGDLMRCMSLAAGLFRDARQDNRLFPPAKILEMATLNAARTLQMSDRIGSLEMGKKADLVMHDTDRPEWRPLLNVIAQLVWSADGRGVHSVWVDGRRVVEDYRVTTVDEHRLYAEVQIAAKALIARAGLPDRQVWPVL